MLEYYSGVIILTTNRVGEFDEAFRSRIHVSLYYPKLDKESTSKIWEKNILRIKTGDLGIDLEEEAIRRFSERHWIENTDKPSRRWNGRQIKNAFQTALALANWDFYESKRSPERERPLVKAEHFDRVAKTSAHFDDYISDIHNIDEGNTYSVLAARDEVRIDSHPAMSSLRSEDQDRIPRSRRPPGARRGVVNRMGKVDKNRKGDEDGDENDVGDVEIRQLELELELTKLRKQKQVSTRDEIEGLPVDEDDEPW